MWDFKDIQISQNYYLQPKPRLNSSSTDLFNGDNLPKDWWLATGTPAVRRHEHKPKLLNKNHMMWDTSQDPMYPVYTYDNSNDEVNIDWEKSNPNSPRPERFWNTIHNQ